MKFARSLRPIFTKFTLLVAPLLAIAAPAAPAVAAPDRVAGGWAQELDLDNGLEQNGILYRGRHVNIDNASCLGLRFAGVRTVGYTETFHRFKCDLDGDDGHIYAARVTITRSTVSRFWWQVTSVSREI